MPVAALGLVLTAAVIHAIWNLAVKRTQQKQVFIWWGVIVGAVLFGPMIFLSPSLPARAWPYILASAFMEGLYYIALAWAYDVEDFSVVYPIARGAAPALLAVWSAIFLHEYPTALGLLGLLLIVMGLVVVGGGAIFARSTSLRVKDTDGSEISVATAVLSSKGSRLPFIKTEPIQVLKRDSSVLSVARFSWKGIVAALLVAVCISIYTTIDGAAVKFAPSVPYTVMIMGLSAIFAAPVIFLRYGRRSVVSEWKTNWKTLIIVGVLMLLSYMLVLTAYSLGKVTYAGAVREVSVVFGAVLGSRLLGEGFGIGRTIGAALIFAGILVIAVLG